MRDGLTRKRRSRRGGADEKEFFRRYRTTLVLVNTTSAGMQYRLRQPRTILGRGPGVDLAFNDPDMSRQHASIELTGDGPRIRDLGSTNGLFLNGSPVQSADLGHGDRLRIGGLEFQLAIEARREEPDVFEIPAGV